MSRKHKNKYGQINVEYDFHQLDHSLTSDDYQEITREIISKCKIEKTPVIRLITGKGINSKKGAIIKPLVMQTLEQLKAEGQIQDFDFDLKTSSGINTGAFRVKIY